MESRRRVLWPTRERVTVEGANSRASSIATLEFKKASGILSGLWEKVQERPDEFLDRKTIETEGLDVATRDFIAGMTDRYAVRLFEQLYIPKPWTVD